MPVLELLDYEFMRRLRRLGRISLLPEAALTSGRRWQRLGAMKVTMINKLMIAGYRLGVPVSRLAVFYRAFGQERRTRLATSSVVRLAAAAPGERGRG